MAEEISGSASQGPATDAANTPVVDPTANVRELVEAAIKRQDDLREMESRHVREILALRAESARNEEDCIKQIADLRAKHADQIREAETARINAIRAVDVSAVQQAATVAATQATTLAAQVATSAETLRTQVAAAASAATIALAAALEPVQKDIADLRRAQYEAQGQKTQVVETRAQGGSVGMWVGLAAAVLFGVISAVVAVISALP